jgi:superfamily I DNA/RNA helicase
MERVANLKPQASICFITYTHALKDLVQTGLHESVANRIKIKTHTQYLRDQVSYDYVFLDEVQDIKPEDLAKIKRFARRIYIAGDGDQRIYTEGATDEQITETIQPTTWKLLEIFRLTQLLQKLAQTILPRTQIIEGLHAANTAEVTIRLVKHKAPENEAAWVWREAHDRARAGEPSVILFPTHRAIAEFANHVATSMNLGNPPSVQNRNYDPFNAFWSEKNVDLMYFGNSHGDLGASENRPIVYLMTFHSSKGLDFRNVFIPGMNRHAVIVSEQALADDPELDRRLLFVAVTRSRENLFISYSDDEPHPLLTNLPAGVITTVDSSSTSGFDDEEEFF